MFTMYFVISLQILTMAVCIASIIYCHRMHSMVKAIVAKQPMEEDDIAEEEQDESAPTENILIADAHTFIEKKDIRFRSQPLPDCDLLLIPTTEESCLL